MAFVCLLGAVLVVMSVTGEDSDSDVEYDTPQAAHVAKKARQPLLKQGKADKAAKQARGTDESSSESENEDDKVVAGERKSQDGDEVGEPPKPRHRMVRRYEAQESFLLEGCFVVWLAFAAIMYFKGKGDNALLVKKWVTINEEVLRRNFALVGDDGNFDKKDEEPGPNEPPRIIRDNASNFSLYCSGRKHCCSCNIEFQLLARQDLLSTVWNLMSKAKDEVVMTFELGDADMQDPFVVAVVPTRGHRETKEKSFDLKDCAVSKGPGYKGLPKTSVLMCDAEAAASEVVSEKVRSLIASHPGLFHSIHITDDSPFPETRLKKVVRFRFHVPAVDKISASATQIREMTSMAMYVVDQIAKVRLSPRELRLTKELRQAKGALKVKEALAARAEEAANKKRAAKKKEKEELQAQLEQLPLAQRRRVEEKMAKKEQKKAQSRNKGKVQFLSL